jgi:hypothetical protein
MKDGQTIGEWLNWDFEAKGNFEIRNKIGALIYFERSDKSWGKYEYDSKGNETYYIDSRDYWERREWDSKGNRLVYQDSNGEFIDKRPKPNPELTLESLAEQVLKLSEIVTKFVNKP